ncbi:MAG: hypothetical protein ACJ72N_08190 [Labedaea sp.]
MTEIETEITAGLICDLSLRAATSGPAQLDLRYGLRRRASADWIGNKEVR